MTFARVLARARSASVLVVGDICLDRWCRYNPALAEPSRETGIPRVAVTSAEVTPGAGGTVAANLAALGARRVDVLGVVGEDGHAAELRRALGATGIGSALLVETDAVRTFTYTKLINDRTGIEDLPRVDFVNTSPLPSAVERRLVGRFLDVAEEYDAVVVADQAETDHGGVVTPRVREAVCEKAQAHTSQVFVADSRRRVHCFRHVIATPNEAEAAAACMEAFGEVDYRRLYRAIGGPALVVSAGGTGAWLVDDSESRLFQAHAAGEPIDTCGAGDSLSAGLTLALAAGADAGSALAFGIIVAGVTVTKPGTGTASPAEVLAVADQVSDEVKHGLR